VLRVGRRSEVYVAEGTGGHPARRTASQCDLYTARCVHGTDHADRIVGTAARDVIFPGAGDDRVSSGGGDDRIDTTYGRDFVDAGPGNDIVHTFANDDLLLGGAGRDFLYAGNGEDVLRGGRGRDEHLPAAFADDLVVLGGLAGDLELQRYRGPVVGRRRLLRGVDPDARPVGHLRVGDDGLDHLAGVLGHHEHGSWLLVGSRRAKTRPYPVTGGLTTRIRHRVPQMRVRRTSRLPRVARE
jgi:hypothetical protein